MSDELKACPFCGEDYSISEVCIGDVGHAFTCNRCHATGMVLDPSAPFYRIVDAWNNRSLEDALTAENATLKEKLAQAREALDPMIKYREMKSDWYVMKAIEVRQKLSE